MIRHELSNRAVETAGLQETFFSICSFFGRVWSNTENVIGKVQKIMDEHIIGAKDIKLSLFKLDDSKSMGPDKIHQEISKCLLGNRSYTNAIRKLFAKCVEYEMTPNILEKVIVMALHKKGDNKFKK